MSSTNHTANYNLPQFVGSDKPAWLGDINPAMSAIDSAMHANATAAAQASTDAGNAQSAATAAAGAASDAATAAATAQGTANTAIANIGASNERIAALEQLLVMDQITNANFQFNGTTSTINLTLAQNPDGSVFKFYGYFVINNTSGSTINPMSGKTNAAGRLKTGLYLRTAPSEAFMIRPVGLCHQLNSNVEDITAFVETDGEITLNWWGMTSQANNIQKRINIPACLYFNTNFGDTPASN